MADNSLHSLDDFEEIEDLFEQAIGDVMDADITYRDMAHACIEALKGHLKYQEKSNAKS